MRGEREAGRDFRWFDERTDLPVSLGEHGVTLRSEVAVTGRADGRHSSRDSGLLKARVSGQHQEPWQTRCRSSPSRNDRADPQHACS